MTLVCPWARPNPDVAVSMVWPDPTRLNALFRAKHSPISNGQGLLRTIFYALKDMEMACDWVGMQTHSTALWEGIGCLYSSGWGTSPLLHRSESSIAYQMWHFPWHILAAVLFQLNSNSRNPHWYLPSLQTALLSLDSTRMTIQWGDRFFTSFLHRWEPGLRNMSQLKDWQLSGWPSSIVLAEEVPFYSSGRQPTFQPPHTRIVAGRGSQERRGTATATAQNATGKNFRGKVRNQATKWGHKASVSSLRKAVTGSWYAPRDEVDN